ncbi:hypothetical protein PRZ48_003487 [Zasmidium cellare]|uniref:DSBA-like thioredoxin domain-containing protein n=1 Tax=Zasmidium cellare TaxID=395010 RepID=A0ABR0EV83_ZASCE|nr:hypothetical protein PRZ48_003487 [Zasmidium cellare]
MGGARYVSPGGDRPHLTQLLAVIQKNGVNMLNAIRTRLERVGRENGIQFNFESKIGSTRDSHRLLNYARQHGPGWDKSLLEAIFRWHFEEGGDITSHEGLTKVATSVGLPEDEVSKLLASDENAAAVDTLASLARQKGIYSVPTIEINRKRINVEGAGDVSEFFEAIINARKLMPEEELRVELRWEKNKMDDAQLEHVLGLQDSSLPPLAPPGAIRTC